MNKILSINILLILTFISCAIQTKETIVENSSFEDGKGQYPEHWNVIMYNNNHNSSTIEWVSKGAKSGKKCILINNILPSSTILFQEIPIEQNKIYRISCWVKTRNVGQEGKGAFISVLGNDENVKGKQGNIKKWQEYEFHIMTGSDVNIIQLIIGLGDINNYSKGKAWFDDVKVEEIGDIPTDYPFTLMDNEEHLTNIINIQTQKLDHGQSAGPSSKLNSNKYYIFKEAQNGSTISEQKSSMMSNEYTEMGNQRSKLITGIKEDTNLSGGGGYTTQK